MRSRHTMIALLLAACFSALSDAQEIVKPVTGFTLYPPIIEDESGNFDERQARQESIAGTKAKHESLEGSLLSARETVERARASLEAAKLLARQYRDGDLHISADDPIEFRVVDGEPSMDRRSA